MTRRHTVMLTLLAVCWWGGEATAQTVDRPRPEAWGDLAFGGRFMDRFLPMPVHGPLTRETWGADHVRPRYVENGLEDNEWSYWGGNALLGDDGKYHLFVCRWLESSSRGHMEWPRSIVVHAVADRSPQTPGASAWKSKRKPASIPMPTSMSTHCGSAPRRK